VRARQIAGNFLASAAAVASRSAATRNFETPVMTASSLGSADTSNKHRENRQRLLTSLSMVLPPRLWRHGSVGESQSL
jgi:hypothetical protein